MPINEYIKKQLRAYRENSLVTLSNITCLVGAGFGIDALRNLHNGITTGDTTYYSVAAMEIFGSGLLGAAGYAMRKQMREHIELIKTFQDFEESNKKLLETLERVIGSLEKELNYVSESH